MTLRLSYALLFCVFLVILCTTHAAQSKDGVRRKNRPDGNTKPKENPASIPAGRPDPSKCRFYNAENPSKNSAPVSEILSYLSGLLKTSSDEMNVPNAADLADAEREAKADNSYRTMYETGCCLALSKSIIDQNEGSESSDPLATVSVSDAASQHEVSGDMFVLQASTGEFIYAGKKELSLDLVLQAGQRAYEMALSKLRRSGLTEKARSIAEKLEKVNEKLKDTKAGPGRLEKPLAAIPSVEHAKREEL